MWKILRVTPLCSSEGSLTLHIRLKHEGNPEFKLENPMDSSVMAWLFILNL